MARRKAESAAARRPVRRRSASSSTRRPRRPSARSAARRSRRRSPRRRWLLYGIAAGAAAGIAVLAWLIWPSWRAARGFAAGDWPRPTLVYGRAERLTRGAPLAQDELVARLRGLGYRFSGDNATATGSYRTGDGVVEVGLRAFPVPEGEAPERLLRIRFRGARVRALLLDGEEVASAALEPPLIGLLMGDDLRDRRPIRAAELPPHVVRAILAAEDATFYEHPGISLSGLLRALWVNLRSGEIQQGGSTLTQQLVKNLYLTHERTLLRKIREGALSLFVELRFEKDEILEAYLNEAYWGRAGRVSLMGLGAAARAWFGCDARELDVAQAALLAGMLRSPGGLDPARHPEASRERRDEVLARMHELGWLDRAAWLAGAADPPVLSRPDPTPRIRGYFLDAVAREARRRFGAQDLRARGLVVLTTLDPADQLAAERAVAAGLAESEQEGADPGLQGALLSLDPRTGQVLAWVGGRDYPASQFDRLELARRQPGSAFKPVIFTAAFARGAATPSTLLEDAPLRLETGGELWEPQNVDRRFRGWVTARRALEDSVNVATVRLGERTGWPQVVETAHQLGIVAPLEPLPALGLGALEVAPRSLATVYATLANRGWRTEPHLIRAVLDRDGAPLPGGELPAAVQVVSPQVAYQVAYVLEGVLERGTAAGARALGVVDRLAGKTGTTNGGRDSWFAGFSPERATLVWVGYDDNRQSRLSGSLAALPIWARFTVDRRPPGGYERLDPPPGVFFVEVDPETGGFAGRRCPEVLEEAFVDGTAPEDECYLHGRGRRPRLLPGEEGDWDDRRRRPWWRQIFRGRPDTSLPPARTPR